MCMHDERVNNLVCFQFVNLSFAILIYRTSAREPRMGRRKKEIFPPL